MGKSFTNIKGRTSNKKAAGQKKIRPRVVTAVTTRSIRVYIYNIDYRYIKIYIKIYNTLVYQGTQVQFSPDTNI